MAFTRSFVVLLALLSASILASPHDSQLSYYKPLDGKSRCHGNDFYYKTKDCCLFDGGPPYSPPPPPGKGCPPSSHYWNKDLSSCTPRHRPREHEPPPQCCRDYEWDVATQSCHPHHHKPSHTSKHHKPSQTPCSDYLTPTEKGHGPKPTEKPYYSPKSGHYKRSSVPFCPHSFEACPIHGLTGSEYECLDTTAELTSCGGCASTLEGQDCTSINAAWNVGCEAGSCVVYTCLLGYKVSTDGKSCIPV